MSKGFLRLKDILKPPFRHDHCGVGEIHCGVKYRNYSESRLAQIRGWGFFQDFENGAQLQDEFKDFVVAALNEKWEKDYGQNDVPEHGDDYGEEKK